ncbi:hypothetical protein XA67_01040 [Comamonas thiooxydans]|nr:hypothetical protein XA67_01040 [Comamonas thiooxydans]
MGKIVRDQRACIQLLLQASSKVLVLEHASLATGKQVALVLRLTKIFNNFCKYWPSTDRPCRIMPLCFCDFFLPADHRALSEAQAAGRWKPARGAAA